MAIFQNSVVREYAKKLDAPTLDARFQIFQAYFLDPTRQAEIRKMKEEEFKPSFLRELFKECLGYTIRPDEGFNFTVEHKNVGVFRNLPNPLTCTRYHSLAIERSSLPECLDITAWTADGEIMGVRHKTLAVEGMQFHPESILTECGHELLNNFLEEHRA